jgi:hypothetical protein
MRQHFHEWYAYGVKIQLQNGTLIKEVKVDRPISVMKNRIANWIINAWSELSRRPQLAIRGFDKTGIV